MSAGCFLCVEANSQIIRRKTAVMGSSNNNRYSVVESIYLSTTLIATAPSHGCTDYNDDDYYYGQMILLTDHASRLMII